MKNILLNPTPLRQKFIEYLTFNRKAERTVHTYVSFIYSLAGHYHRSPDLLSHEEIQHWLYHLIAERKQAPSTVNLAINAVRSFYGKMLQQDRAAAPSDQAPTPARPRPGVYSMAEVAKLLTVGTEGNLRAPVNGPSSPAPPAARTCPATLIAHELRLLSADVLLAPRLVRRRACALPFPASPYPHAPCSSCLWLPLRLPCERDFH